MHKKNRHFSQKKIRKPRFNCLDPLLSPRATHLGLMGFPLLLAGIWGIASRLHTLKLTGAVGIMLHLGDEIEYIVAGLCILIGGMLLLDYMERREADGK